MTIHAWFGAVVAAVIASSGLAAAAPVDPQSAIAEPALVTVGPAPRAHRDVTWVRPGTLDRARLSGWTAIYDHDTDIPLRMWGPGQAAPGTMASAAAAEAWARAFLAAHLDVLAPGAVATDFVLVANQLDPSRDVRSLGFAQYANGIAVRGGAVSFAFKRDRMIMSGSTALPNVAAALGMAGPMQRAARLATGRVASAATAWLATAGRAVAVRGGPAADPVIVPIVHARGAGAVDISYTVAEQVAVETIAGAPGRWNVFVDAGTGAAFARESTLMFESGVVQFDVSVRGPGADAGRHALGAPRAVHRINSSEVMSDAGGVVSWTGAQQVTLTPGLSGPLVAITNMAGALASDSLALATGGSAIWSHPDDPAVDAQLAAFVYASQAKQFVRDHIDPALGYLDHQLSVSVNETSGTCNAYSTGDDLHFFPRTPDYCENTGRLADIVYHEFGHSLHRQALIPGVGQFDGAMSEGIGDTLAVSITGDPGMGRGFYLATGRTNEPLRDVNPAQKKLWPQDLIGEVHSDGEIYGETMWDLRGRLQASMGADAGFAQFLKLYYGTIQRAIDIPSSFAEVLVADDDDGDLANGTPHECDIVAAFLAHGLFDPLTTGEIARPVRDGFAISVSAAAPASVRCNAPVVQSAQVDWRVRGGILATVPLVAHGTAFAGAIPTQPAGAVIEYTVKLTLANGVIGFPDNRADPYYQFYVGAANQIWCADFEHGAPDWTHSATPAAMDRWEVGPPRGLGGDPAAAFAGDNVLGVALGGDGRYPPQTTTAARSPTIDLHGNTKVHLQYYRWLGVEDAVYDQATIKANGTQVWKNLANPIAPRTALVGDAYNHIDREWRFQDIDLSAEAGTGTMQLEFGLTSDPGFEAAGWNLDNVCLVTTGAVCGNGQQETGETCDDGNTAGGDGCSASCQDEVAGGCCGVAGHPAAPAALALITLGGALRRRRRR